MLSGLVNSLNIQLNSLRLSPDWVSITEVFVIAIIVLAFYKRFIKNTQSENLVRGLLFIVVAWLLSEILIKLNLTILGVFIKSLVTLIALSLIVIFQPELRKFLGFLGQRGFAGKSLWQGPQKENVDVIKEVIETVKLLSKSRIGALLVFQKEISANSFFDVGTKLNADVSTELLLTIFHPNTPLHDGAVVIKYNKILSAGVLLPLTEDPKLSWKYGTRHRAAIGMSEVSDSVCLVVSEETGDVSVALGGVLKKYEDLTTLKNDLETLLGYKKLEEAPKKPLFTLNSFLGNKKAEQEPKSTKGKV